MAKANVDVVQDFKKFVNKGNVFDLAIGVIIGSTFTAIVNSLVNDIIMPLLSSAINIDLTALKLILKPEVTDAEGEVLKATITLNYGKFFQNVITFLIIAISIYLAIKLVGLIKKGYIRSEIKYVKGLKKKHPEWFDEEDEFGTILYEKLKSEHPEEFKNEIVEEIEAKKETVKSPQEINNELLLRLNENLEKLNNKNENVDN